MSDPPVCGICELHAALPLQQLLSAEGVGRLGPGAGLLVGRFGPWLLRHHPLPSPLLGWLLLDTVRHVGGAADFNAREAAGFGGMLQRSSSLVRDLTGCDRVYAIAFGEGARHVHLHLIPRHASDPASEAWRVADLYRAVAQGERAPADPKAVALLLERARALSGDWPVP